MFENRQLTVFEEKCHWFRNSSKCLKTHCAVNNWPIWTQKVPKEAKRCGLQASRWGFFKNLLSYMKSRLSKTRSVHMYVMPRTVYFDWICTGCSSLQHTVCKKNCPFFVSFVIVWQFQNYFWFWPNEVVLILSLLLPSEKINFGTIFRPFYPIFMSS